MPTVSTCPTDYDLVALLIPFENGARTDTQLFADLRQMMAAIWPEVPKSASRKSGSSPRRHGHSLKAHMLNNEYREMLQCLLEEPVDERKI
jgi:hypothetical protein